MSRLALPLSLCLLTACGPEAAVWVRVEAPFRVPDECDALEVTARRTADGAELFSARHDLAQRLTQFPVEFALSTENRANLGEDALEVEVRVLKGGGLSAPWAFAASRADLVEGQWTQLQLPICDCPR